MSLSDNIQWLFGAEVFFLTYNKPTDPPKPTYWNKTASIRFQFQKVLQKLIKKTRLTCRRRLGIVLWLRNHNSIGVFAACQLPQGWNRLRREPRHKCFPHFYVYLCKYRTEDIFHFTGAKSRRRVAAPAEDDDDDDDAWNKEFTNPLHTCTLTHL